MTTRTGSFSIGFRRGWSTWQKVELPKLALWAKENGFGAIDLQNPTVEEARSVEAAGIKVGSVDLHDFTKILAADANERKERVAKNVEYIKQLAGAGFKIFFTVIIPSEHGKPRKENYDIAVEAYRTIAAAADSAGAKIAIEGWPGGAPYFSSLCCTPETVRAFIRDVGSPSIGINYDPSHLIRLRVDHVRFLKEFASRVWHVHAKDTDVDSEALYEFGTQPPTLAKGHGFGDAVWRYTLPGQGQTRWPEVFKILKDSGYKGIASIELEDERFNGSEEGEKAGLIASRDFLRGI